MRNTASQRWAIMEEALLGALRDAGRAMRRIEERRSHARDDLVMAVRTGDRERVERLQHNLDVDQAYYAENHRSWLELVDQLRAHLQERPSALSSPETAEAPASSRGTRPSAGASGDGGTGGASHRSTLDATSQRPSDREATWPYFSRHGDL